MASRSSLETLRRHLLASLGVGPALLLGCMGSPPSDDEGNVTTNPSTGATTDDGGNDGADGTSSGGSGVPGNPTTGPTTEDPPDPPDPPDPGDGDGDTGVKLDVAQPPDMPPLGDCTVLQADPAVLAEYPDCPIVLDDGLCWSNLYWGCVDLEPGQTCADACPGGSCVSDWFNCAGDRIYDIPAETCGPYEVDGMCCTLAEVGEICGTDGRPFVVGGFARQACVLAGAPVRSRAQLGARVRETLAAHWTAVARAEHASIASFAQFGARLLALGAPAALVRGASTAAADEARHAEFALERAREWCGRELSFGALDTRGAADPRESFADTVLACVREGCIGETLAALELSTLADACVDPKLAAKLRAIADDEARHAALAWRFVQWALVREPGLASRVLAVFDASVEVECDGEPLDVHERELLRAHGCLPADERRSLELEGLRELVRPCAAALTARAHVAASIARQS